MFRYFHIFVLLFESLNDDDIKMFNSQFVFSIRRKEGQSLGEMREKRDRDDAKALAEDRRRQKIEDEKARKAVLDKIKQDRYSGIIKELQPQ